MAITQHCLAVRTDDIPPRSRSGSRGRSRSRSRNRSRSSVKC